MKSATGWGLAACLVWCATVAVTRGLTQQWGPFRTGCVTMGMAGLLGMACGRWRHEKPAGLSRSYLLVCGSCFVFYQVCLLLAISLAADGASVVVVGMLNYLWPALTLALGVPLLHYRWRGWLLAGLALTVAGEALVVGARLLGGHAVPWSRHAAEAYLLATLAALAWALYSNLARRLARHAEGNAAPLFFLAAAAVLLPLALRAGPMPRATPATLLAAAWMAIFPGLLAYTWWDRGMRHGQATVLTIASFLIPLGSTAVTCRLLRVWPAWPVWLGAGLVIGGAFVCHASVAEPADAEA